MPKSLEMTSGGLDFDTFMKELLKIAKQKPGKPKRQIRKKEKNVR